MHDLATERVCVFQMRCDAPAPAFSLLLSCSFRVWQRGPGGEELGGVGVVWRRRLGALLLQLLAGVTAVKRVWGVCRLSNMLQMRQLRLSMPDTDTLLRELPAASGLDCRNQPCSVAGGSLEARASFSCNRTASTQTHGGRDREAERVSDILTVSFPASPLLLLPCSSISLSVARSSLEHPNTTRDRGPSCRCRHGTELAAAR